jgi:F0F1-type ATP synthase membrane subunit b/b'
MIQPILKLIGEREAYKQKTKAEIRDVEVKIEELKERFLSKESAARKDAATERTDLMNEGMIRAEGFLNESRDEVSKIRQSAEKEVENEIKKTQPLLHVQAEALVAGIAEKLIGRRVDA